MEVKDYCSIAVLVVVVIAYGINLLLAIKCKKSAGATKTEIDSFVLDELSKLPNYILSAESLYASVFKDGVKSGAFKLKEVLENVEEDCANSNYTFDKSYWTTLINNIVAVMNGEDTFQSTETTDSTNVIIK